MGPMTSSIMLIFIIGSACCVLIGGIMTAVRIVKLVRSERTLAGRIRAALQVEKANSCMGESEHMGKIQRKLHTPGRDDT
jgi:hypothetical protein